MIYNNCGVLVSGSLGRRKSYERGGLAMAKKEMYNIQHTEKNIQIQKIQICLEYIQNVFHWSTGKVMSSVGRQPWQKMQYLVDAQKYEHVFFLAVAGHFIILATVGHVGDLSIDCNCLRYFSAFCKHQLHGIYTCLILPADACYSNDQTNIVKCGGSQKFFS